MSVAEREPDAIRRERDAAVQTLTDAGLNVDQAMAAAQSSAATVGVFESHVRCNERDLERTQEALLTMVGIISEMAEPEVDALAA